MEEKNIEKSAEQKTKIVVDSDLASFEKAAHKAQLTPLGVDPKEGPGVEVSKKSDFEDSMSLSAKYAGEKHVPKVPLGKPGAVLGKDERIN